VEHLYAENDRGIIPLLSTALDIRDEEFHFENSYSKHKNLLLNFSLDMVFLLCK